MMGRADDISAIRDLEKGWCDAWNAHDMNALARLLTPDTDFVTVGGDWLRGRQEFRNHHVALHATIFKHSTFAVKSTTVKFIQPDLALTHVKWRIEGDFDPDGTPRKPRTGIFTQVLQKSRNRWRVLASQNTNDAKLSIKAFMKLLNQRHWE